VLYATAVFTHDIRFWKLIFKMLLILIHLIYPRIYLKYAVFRSYDNPNYSQLHGHNTAAAINMEVTDTVEWHKLRPGACSQKSGYYFFINSAFSSDRQTDKTTVPLMQQTIINTCRGFKQCYLLYILCSYSAVWTRYLSHKR
jgi:hypothetical protein